MNKGKVTQIFRAPKAEAPMEEVQTIRAIEGFGFEGDRYSTGEGTYSKTAKKIRHATLISQEVISRGAPFEAKDTRRNLVTHGIDLETLRNTEFSVGSVLMRYFDVCTPCKIPSKLSGKPGFIEAFPDIYGGIRAEIISTGDISVGDEITIVRKLNTKEESSDPNSN